jgi:hypothetical protein
MRKFIVILLVGAGLASGITTSAEETTELKGAVLVISVKNLAGKFENEAKVTKWPATVGQDLINIPTTKLTAPVYVANSPAGGAAVHFSAGSGLCIPGFSKQFLAGKSFTIFVRSIPQSQYFGFCGNASNGGAAVPRLFLTAGMFAYNELTNTVGASQDRYLNQESLFVYRYDAENKIMRMMLNGTVMNEKKNVAPVNNFAGDALAVPMQVGNKPQEGFLLDIVVFDRVLNDAEIKQTAKFIQQ